MKVKLENKLNPDDLRSRRETPAGGRGWGDPAGAKRRGGSPGRPRKAKCLSLQSTGTFNSVKIRQYFFSTL